MHTSLEVNRHIHGLTADAMLPAMADTKIVTSVDTPPEHLLSYFIATCFATDTSSDKQWTAIPLEL